MKSIFFLLVLFSLPAFGAATATYTDGVTQIFNPSNSRAGMNIGSITDNPSTMNNGDLWYATTDHTVRIRINGAVENLASREWVATQGYGNAQADEVVFLDGSVPMTGALTFTGTTHPGLRLNNLNSTQRDAMTPLMGYIIANTTTSAVEWYDGSAWTGIGGGTGSVATDAIFDAAGDLVYGTGANTAARLAIGTANKLLQVNAGATAPEWTDAVSLASVTATTGNIGSLVFEGATADAFETTIAVTDPTADRTFTIPNATDTAVGKATTDALTNKTLTDASNTLPCEIGVALSDETTDITTGTAKITIRMPFAMTVTAVRSNVNTVSSSGLPTVDINEAGVSILSTALTIDASEKTSTTAATPAVISDTALADDAEITFDIDTAGTGAKGLKVWIIGTR